MSRQVERCRILLLSILLSVSGAAASSEQTVREMAALTEQIMQLHTQGRFQEALLLAKQALRLKEQELGPRHPDTAMSLHLLAALYVETGDYKQAERPAQQAVAIRTEVLGAQHSDTAKSLNNLGLIYARMGKFAQAEHTIKLSIVAREKTVGPDHPDIAAPLCNLAQLYFETGSYSQAELLYRRALDISIKALGDGHPATAVIMHNLARFYEQTGSYIKAEGLLIQVLAIQEKTLGPEHPHIGYTLNNLATAYVQTGAYEKARPLYERSLLIAQKELGAESATSAALSRSLGSMYLEEGDFGHALPLLQRSVAVHQKVMGAQHADTADSITELASLKLRMGAHEEAQDLYEKALGIRQALFGEEHPDVAMSLSNLARALEQNRDYGRAIARHDRALGIFSRTLNDHHPVVVEALRSSAVTQWAAGNRRTALTQLLRSQSAQARITDLFMLTGSENRKQVYLQKFRQEIFKDVSFSMSGGASGEEVKLGLSSVLQYKGRVLDAMSGSVSQLRSSLKQEDRNVLDAMARLSNRLSALTYQEVGAGMTKEYQRQLVQLTQELEELQVTLANRSSLYRHRIAPITLEAVQREIPKDAVLLEWFRYQPFDPKVSLAEQQQMSRYAVYILRHSGNPIAVDVGDARTIEASVHHYLNALTNRGRPDLKPLATALSNRLLEPLNSYIKGAKQLLVSPDGALNLVPMAALVDDQGDYLLNRFAISYLTSGRDLVRFASMSTSQGKTVMVANPAYGDSSDATRRTFELPAEPTRSADLDRSGLQFRPLANTTLEVQALKALMHLDDSDVLTGKHASEAHLKALHSPRMVHIASHGFFLTDHQVNEQNDSRSGRADPRAAQMRENPLLRSGIALAGANMRRAGKDDGILTALEVAQLDLQGTQLVVLSACDSGIGEVQNGEGVYGLRRALVLAGAQAHVTSLWKVADVATRELMIGFYERLLTGEGRSEALRHAQQAMLSTPGRSHPYFWAGFVPGGNWTPIVTSAQNVADRSPKQSLGVRRQTKAATQSPGGA